MPAHGQIKLRGPASESSVSAGSREALIVRALRPHYDQRTKVPGELIVGRSNAFWKRHYPTHHRDVPLRFELALALVNGELATDDLPEEWNRRMEQYLGVRPETDREGVLQDIHSSQGGMGYFPDHLLGSMLSAQLWEAAGRECSCESYVRYLTAKYGTIYGL